MIKCIAKAFEVLSNIIIDSSLFALLSSNALSNLMSDFVANENVVICQDISLDS